MSPYDIKSIEMLRVQGSAVLISIYAYIILYSSIIEGIELIYSKYESGEVDPVVPDEVALQAIYIFFFTQLIFTQIAVARYNLLSEEKANGEFDYSLEPNINIIISNIISIISNIYLVNGAEGIVARSTSQAIFGV